MNQSYNAFQKFGLFLTRALVFFGFVLWYMLASSFLQLAMMGYGGTLRSSLAFVMSLLLFWALLRQIVKSIRKVKKDFEFKWPNFANRKKALWIGLLLILMLVLQMVWGVVKTHIGGTETTANEVTLNKLTSANGIYSQALMFLLAVVIGPVVEELIFRGLFLAYFDRFKAFWVGPILSGCFFGLMHIINEKSLYHALIDIPSYIMMGIILAYVYKKSNKISNSITLHAGNNLVAQILSWIAHIG
ncbi:CPBP family intramembrane glutamic endopeptidase [Eupransor demetentiae]|uniref:CAAX protease family (YdiL) n=1 Tax=Eupransor demetentiae TaxID=3109584 RepID=A0ABM9N685_9LACO|nr:CAAX protease family (YdiL) [Lactobacillaceae bacterium LMG 33000]